MMGRNSPNPVPAEKFNTKYAKKCIVEKGKALQVTSQFKATVKGKGQVEGSIASVAKGCRQKYVQRSRGGDCGN
jgi:hypothetical protein